MADPVVDGAVGRIGGPTRSSLAPKARLSLAAPPPCPSVLGTASGGGVLLRYGAGARQLSWARAARPLHAVDRVRGGSPAALALLAIVPAPPRMQQALSRGLETPARAGKAVVVVGGTVGRAPAGGDEEVEEMHITCWLPRRSRVGHPPQEQQRSSGNRSEGEIRVITPGPSCLSTPRFRPGTGHIRQWERNSKVKDPRITHCIFARDVTTLPVERKKEQQQKKNTRN